MYLLAGTIYINMQKKPIHKYQWEDHTGRIQKQTSVSIWKKILEVCDYVIKIRENYQNYLFNKREIFYDKPSTSKKRWEFFV